MSLIHSPGYPYCELKTIAKPKELASLRKGTVDYLKSKSVRTCVDGTISGKDIVFIDVNGNIIPSTIYDSRKVFVKAPSEILLEVFGLPIDNHYPKIVNKSLIRSLLGYKDDGCITAFVKDFAKDYKAYHGYGIDGYMRHHSLHTIVLIGQLIGVICHFDNGVAYFLKKYGAKGGFILCTNCGNALDFCNAVGTSSIAESALNIFNITKTDYSAKVYSPRYDLEEV